MRNLILGVMLCLALGACARRPAHEQAVIDYVEAVRAGNCESAFSLLSARTRDALEAERSAHRGRTSDSTVDALYCSPGPLERVKLEKTRTKSVEQSAATVELIERVPSGYLIPGFWPTGHEDRTIEVRVLREEEMWRVERDSLLEELERRARVREVESAIERRVREENERLLRGE